MRGRVKLESEIQGSRAKSPGGVILGTLRPEAATRGRRDKKVEPREAVGPEVALNDKRMLHRPHSIDSLACHVINWVFAGRLETQ